MELTSLFLLDGLTPEEAEICRRLTEIEEWTCPKGEILYDPQHARRCLAYLLEGHARVMQGRVVMNDLCVGDVFGVAALFGSTEPYPSTVVAVTDCRLVLIPQETVSRWMAAVPAVGENYVRFLSDRIRFLNRRLGTLTAGQTDGRLWKYLLAHRDAAGVVTLSGGMNALAKRLDMGRSSLYRSLDALSDAGRIRREGKKIVILQTEE
ncbi:MAG: Crp/Fnr family transcriptional regulator [Clostridia bacterium]|nr:Crp/Fnr family transcriptional regulator [Clostridia bacterium]